MTTIALALAGCGEGGGDVTRTHPGATTLITTTGVGSDRDLQATAAPWSPSLPLRTSSTTTTTTTTTTRPGGPPLDYDASVEATWTLAYGDVSVQYGREVAGGADVDGDGALDIVVTGQGVDGDGDGLHDGMATLSGAADPEALTMLPSPSGYGWLFGVYADMSPGLLAITSLGSANLIPAGASPGWIVETGPIEDDAYGWAVALTGDLDGDGGSELAVGSTYSDVHNWPIPATFCGRTYFYPDDLVGEHDASEAWAVIVGTTPVACVGNLAEDLGDVDGDGRDDVMVGSYSTRTIAGYGDEEGTASIFYQVPAGSSVSADADALVNGTPGDMLAWSGVGKVDLDGDGLSDFVLGAPQELPYLTSATGPGYVSLWTGAPTGLHESTDAWIRIDGEVAGDDFGDTVEAVGDADGDGEQDLLVGSRSSNVGQGTAYLIHGPFSAATYAVLDMGGVTRFDAAGDSGAGQPLSRAGDLDGDGTDDFLLGNSSRTYPGEAWVMTGPW